MLKHSYLFLSKHGYYIKTQGSDPAAAPMKRSGIRCFPDCVFLPTPLSFLSACGDTTTREDVGIVFCAWFESRCKFMDVNNSSTTFM